MLRLPKLLHHAIRDKGAAIVCPRSGAYKADMRKLSGIGDGQAAQKESIEHGENSSVRTDTQSNRENGCKAKERRLAESTEAQEQIAIPTLQASDELLIAYRLDDGSCAAEL